MGYMYEITNFYKFSNDVVGFVFITSFLTHKYFAYICNPQKKKHNRQVKLCDFNDKVYMKTVTVHIPTICRCVLHTLFFK